MRIISGEARGLRLESCKNSDLRPTTDRIKESIFNIIQFKIRDMCFLDLFGGTGQIGIEAASRGASRVFIVEKNQQALNIINNNISLLSKNLRQNIIIINDDAVNFVKNTVMGFDVLFLDPPYKSDLINNILPYIHPIMNNDGIIITETLCNSDISDKTHRFKLYKTYKYGKIFLNVYASGNYSRGEK